jgi:hypothetical protein
MNRFTEKDDYMRTLKDVADQAERFHRASLGKLSAGENAQAWREFSALADEALRSGRLWDPDCVRALAAVLLGVVAEQREIERVERGLADAGNDKAKLRNVTSVIRGLSTLAAVDAKAVEFEEDPEGARRVAGYLNFDAQPRRTEL